MVPMDKIVKLLVLLVVLYVAYSVGWPWLQGLLNRSPMNLGGANSGEESLCVTAAERAVDAFADRLRLFISPPIDVDAWDETVSRSRDEIAEAERGCRCHHDACREAQRALSELDEMVSDYDGSVHDGRGLPANGARRLESLYGIVDRAKASAP